MIPPFVELMIVDVRASAIGNATPPSGRFSAAVISASADVP
jgi:hypothetical protein